MDAITGQTLIGWGVKPGAHFKEALATANRMRGEGVGQPAILAAIQALVPATIPLRATATPYARAIDAETEAERANVEAVFAHMDELMRVPTIQAGAVMPDACPSGSTFGTIPVGGVVACADAIHPGFHSADICCSVAITVLRADCDPRALLDAVQAVTHFGPGGRRAPALMPASVASAIDSNTFLSDPMGKAVGDFGS